MYEYELFNRRTQRWDIVQRGNSPVDAWIRYVSEHPNAWVGSCRNRWVQNKP